MAMELRADDTACGRAILALEASMQDGLSDLDRAADLHAEARHGAEAGSAETAEICGFLTSSEAAYGRAQTHFGACMDRLEQAFGACGDPDWSALSASPELCAERLSDIAAARTAIAAEAEALCR
jgi:hypothetical protein